MKTLRLLLNILAHIASLAFPLLYLWQGSTENWNSVALLMALLWGVKGLIDPPERRFFILVIAVLFALFALVRSELFYFYPIGVNLLMLALFGGSLWQKQTLVERLARLREPALPEFAVRYTRVVTQLWCGLFILNIVLLSLFLAMQQYQLWAWYSGVIAYVLMGGLMVGEYGIRQILMKKERQHDIDCP
ncbi:hypothetical protein [Lonepinella sp. BR2357]|uniref:hypothetical protein n=1 Tax=Lonepinella sp. BR2357 TaxID=3434549 RepID=UPI003F6E34AB